MNIEKLINGSRGTTSKGKGISVLRAFVFCAIMLQLFSCSDVDRTNPADINWAANSSSSTIANSSGELSSGEVHSSSSATFPYVMLIDPRDGITYKTLVIGSQTWMTENLNYLPTSGTSWCYQNTPANCAIYGRLYDLTTAKTVCPVSWHLPTDAEWGALEDIVGGSDSAGTPLKANSSLWNTNEGTDAVGFSGLPGGKYNGAFGYLGNLGGWWIASPTLAQYRFLNGTFVEMNTQGTDKGDGLSVRCLKDFAATPSSSSIPVSSSTGVALSSSSANFPYVMITDSRDGIQYRTLEIGTQTWMAENLNYTPPSGNSWCYKDSTAYCTTYGRLYDWAAAMSACPTGWHLSDSTEWAILGAAVGGISTAGTVLKASSALWKQNSGTDDYGFSGLPGGLHVGATFGSVGSYGYWWTATRYGATSLAYGPWMSGANPDFRLSYDGQANGYSVRCLKDQ